MDVITSRPRNALQLFVMSKARHKITAFPCHINWEKASTNTLYMPCWPKAPKIDLRGWWNREKLKRKTGQTMNLYNSWDSMNSIYHIITFYVCGYGLLNYKLNFSSFFFFFQFLNSTLWHIRHKCRILKSDLKYPWIMEFPWYWYHMTLLKWVITSKFNRLLGDIGHRGPCKPSNHDLYIKIIIFPHIDNTQSNELTICRYTRGFLRVAVLLLYSVSQ